MAREYPKQIIPSFPVEHDRRDFGNWLSGLTDGEGCFFLGLEKGLPRAYFAITLRVDDKPILRLIQSFFQCGRLKHQIRKRSRETCAFEVRRAKDMFEVIVPHFNSHILRAKKNNDFILWKEGVRIIYIKVKYEKNGVRYWTKPRMAEFERLVTEIRNGRKIEKPIGKPVVKILENPIITLF